MEYKQVYACNKSLTHILRKHFAFWKSIEFCLKIALDLEQTGKRCYIDKFQWSIVFVLKQIAKKCS
jgi:hypothetical protein